MNALGCGLGEDCDLEEDPDASPFDLAPDLNKQFCKVTKQDEGVGNEFDLDDMMGECDGIN